MLFAGLEGLGKATLVRRFGARLLGSPRKIERDDLSLPENSNWQLARESFRQTNAMTTRLLRHESRFSDIPAGWTLAADRHSADAIAEGTRSIQTVEGSARVFLIDQADRAGEQAANSLLKHCEEPPDHLILSLQRRMFTTCSPP